MDNILMTHWSISSQLIINEWKKQWYSSNILSSENNLFELYNEDKTVLFKSIDCWLNSSVWLKIANNKELTYIIAEKNNIKVPICRYINRSEFENGDYWLHDFAFPVITKPINGAHWKWVALDILNMKELKEWLTFSFNDINCTRVVVQEQISGEDFRILVINGKVEGVTKRIPPYALGDWKKTINQLISEENLSPNRSVSKILIDDESKKYLKSIWYTLDSILKLGEKINVRKNANLSTWWLSIDYTEKTHEEIKNEAIKIANACWLGFCWIDFFCEDISLWLIEGKGAIIEINATPWIRMHDFPNIWKGRNIAGKIISLAPFINKK